MKKMKMKKMKMKKMKMKKNENQIIENQIIENQINEWKKLKRNDLFISISLIIILLSFNFYLIMKYINFENDEN